MLDKFTNLVIDVIQYASETRASTMKFANQLVKFYIPALKILDLPGMGVRKNQIQTSDNSNRANSFCKFDETGCVCVWNFPFSTSLRKL